MEADCQRPQVESSPALSRPRYLCCSGITEGPLGGLQEFSRCPLPRCWGVLICPISPFRRFKHSWPSVCHYRAIAELKRRLSGEQVACQPFVPPPPTKEPSSLLIHLISQSTRGGLYHCWTRISPSRKPSTKQRTCGWLLAARLRQRQVAGQQKLDPRSAPPPPRAMDT